MMKTYYINENNDSNEEEYSLKYKRSPSRNSIHSIPFAVGCGFFLLLIGLYGMVYIIDNYYLPSPLYIKDEIKYPNRFIAEKAYNNLKILTDLGPRIAGTKENEILTVEFIRQQINLIIQNSNINQTIEQDLQIVSGYNNIENGKTYVYGNLQNIIVKLHGKNNSHNSLLLNSHFDSVPTSPGASDDGINIVTMLEILRKFSQLNEPPINNIIFLFNGAEETGLQASHGFITKHKWSDECQVIINLDAAGGGGKIILFQTGPNTPWLLSYYKKLSFPYGQVAGEEIFQNNLIPSDTDFRIFRDNGGLVGFDMAFYKDGYRYHTKSDILKTIPMASIQHVGDIVLNLAWNIANINDINIKGNEKMIYFDILGIFMIVYTESTGTIINFVIIILSVLVFLKSLFDFKISLFTKIKYLLVTLFLIFLSWFLSAIIIISISYFIDKINYSMSWYGNPWIIFGLYVVPVILCTSTVLTINKNKILSINIQCQIEAHIYRIIWTFLLLIGTIFKIRSSYVILQLVFFNTLSFILIHILRISYSVRKWQIYYVIPQLLSSTLLMYLCVINYSLFIPLSGRIGSDKNIEVIIGLLTLFFTILTTSHFIALIKLLTKFKYFFYILLLIFLCTFFLVFTPIGFPYTEKTPQRYWIIHSERIFHGINGTVINQDSGYFLLNMDRNSPYYMRNYVNFIDHSNPIKNDCSKYLLCGLPLAHPKMVKILDHSTWIPAGPPKIKQKPVFIYSKMNLSQNKSRYTITITGPDRISIYLSPKQAKILKINIFNGEPPLSFFEWNNRNFFMITHIWAKSSASLQFYIDVESSSNNNDLIEIAISGIYVHKDYEKTMEYIKFLNQFPNWTDLTAWIGTFDSFII